MHEQTVTPDSAAASDNSPLSSRIRTSLAVAQGRITSAPARARARLSTELSELPRQVRDAIDRAVEKARDGLRAGLDLPSREEIALLLERIDALDNKLAELEEDSGPARTSSKSKSKSKSSSKKTTSSNKPTSKKNGAPSTKAARRDTIKAVASKGGAKKTAKK